MKTKQAAIALALAAALVATGCRTYAQDDGDFASKPLCTHDGACTPFGPEDAFEKIDREANGG